jgi:metal-responsive CopG/Arc/MetJ family transcriptional regulator
MKTTWDLPDELLREVKSLAAIKGQSMKDFVAEALREKLAAEEETRSRKPRGWKTVYGKADKRDVMRVREVIDEEFSTVNPDDWA